DISHDLRTPLTTVRGYLQLLERTELSDDQQAYLAVARRQARELGALVDRLYEYAYLLDGEPGPRMEPADAGVLVAERLPRTSAGRRGPRCVAPRNCWSGPRPATTSRLTSPSRGGRRVSWVPWSTGSTSTPTCSTESRARGSNRSTSACWSPSACSA